MFSILISFISLCLVFHYTDSVQNEFSVCKKGEYGQPDHICRKVKECPSASEKIKDGISPKWCGFVQGEPIVCCDPSTVSKRVDQPPQTDKENLRAIAIVDKMCKKYKESQYKIERIPPQVLGQQAIYMTTVNCPQIVPLIVGGQKAEPKEFPHMALIGYRQGSKIAWACGGTLISEQYVLSAAHCATGGAYGPPKWIRLGELDYDSHEEDAEPQTLEIVKQIIHPNYKEGLVYDDIALFKLNKTIKFSGYIRPPCLHTSRTIKETYATATGWGVIGYGYLPSEQLLKVNVTLVEEQRCKQLLGQNSQIPRGIDENKMICAGEMTGGKDTCQGDSGGPITFKDQLEPCMYIQVGITSFGNQFCGQPNSPGVYTRVSNYIPWIVSIVWNNTTVN